MVIHRLLGTGRAQDIDKLYVVHCPVQKCNLNQYIWAELMKAGGSQVRNRIVLGEWKILPQPQSVMRCAPSPDTAGAAGLAADFILLWKRDNIHIQVEI